MVPPDDLEERLAFAKEIAREAGDSTLQLFQSDRLQAAQKGDGTPVTEADRAAERLLRARLGSRYPDDGIVGEEEGTTPGRSPFTWFLDPIDGTKSFVRGVPLFGTLIGMEADAESVLGVVYHPALGELAAGAKNLGATWERDGLPTVPARVSSVTQLDQALLCLTSAKAFEECDMGDLHRRLLAATLDDRGWSDCYGHVLVATGRADLVVEPRLHDWDCAPLLPILEAAGGTFTDLDGKRTTRGRNGLATNGHLLEAAVALIRGEG